MATVRRKAKALAGGLVLAACSLSAAAAPAQAQTAPPNAAPSAAASPPVITTFAGTGQFGFGGDGGPATAAKVAAPTGEAEDVAGNVYVADTANNRIRRVSTAGAISTVAGSGSSGFAGDGGPAKIAKLSFPTGVALDSAGNLYIADTGNNRIRKVNTAGTISTIAGSGSRSAMASPPSMTAFHNSGSSCSLTGNGGPATSATLCLPGGVAVDTSGTIYIADSGNNEVRKVISGTITAYAGTGVAGSGGDGGPATKAQVNTPTGVAVDTLHNVYISDTDNNKVRKVNTSGTITTFAGTGSAGFGGDGGKATLGQINDPTGTGIDSLGNVYIADTLNCRIRVVIPKGDILTYAGTGSCGYVGDGGPATTARVNYPAGSIAVDSNNIYFGDTGNSRVRRVHGGPPPNIPEVPYVVILPLSALAVIGAGYVLTRRRQRHPAQTA